MRKIFTIIIAVTIFAPSINLHAHVNQRQEWWKIRLKGLIEERKILGKRTDLDPSVVVLTSADIKRAESMLALFGQYSAKDESLRHEKLVFSSTEIETQIRRTTAPICALNFLEHLINTPGNGSTLLNVKQIVGELLQEQIKSVFGVTDEPLLKAIMDEEISKTEWLYMCQEIVFLRMMNGRDELIELFLKEVSTKTRMEIAARNSPITIVELDNIILTAAPGCMEYILDNHAMKVHTDCLGESWTWQRISERISGIFTHYRAIRKMLGNDDRDAPLTLIRSFYKDPAALDRKIFDEARRRYMDRKASGASAYRVPDAGSNTLVPTIPRDIDGTLLFKEIDSLRKNTAASVTGREDDEFYKSLEEKFGVLSEKFSREAGNCFSAEEEKIRSAKENNSAIIVLNENDFTTARNLFNEKTGLVRVYILKSIEYIRWISDMHTLDTSRFMETYRARLSLNGQFLEMLRSMIHDGTGIAEYEAPALHQRFSYFVKRTSGVLRSIGYSSAISKNEQRYFSRAQLQEIKNRKSEFADAVKLAHSDIAALNLSLQKKIASAGRNRTLAGGKMQEKIFQREIQMLVGKIDDYMKSYERLIHAREAFQSYAAAYSVYREEIEKEIISDSLNHTIETKSIIPMLNNFDPERLKTEYATKAYLGKEIQRDLSRLITLLNNYRRKGADIKEKPAADFSPTIMTRLKERPSITVASWRMNESNFTEIDLKTVAKFERERNRILWHRKAGAGDSNREKTTRVEFPGLKLAFSIPEGWVSGVADAGRDVIGSYNSRDMEASMAIILIPLKDRSLRDIIAFRIRQSRGTAIRQRWGRRDGMEYFWTLAREANGALMEIYSTRHGDSALLLSGTSPKNKYSLFKPKFDAAFNSLKQWMDSEYQSSTSDENSGRLPQFP